MSNTSTVRVNARVPYDVTVGSGLLSGCGIRLSEVISPCRMAVISDSNVAPLYLKTAAKSLEAAGFEVCSHVFPAGEQSKNLSTLSGILEFLAGEHLTRRDCVAALGGGVTGDMAGFAAGCYLRGIRFVQLPTTLLAAVDSSVGGKTAVDLRAGKNLAGLFLQPSAVICDTDCLKTLSHEIFSDGLAEAIKTGILFDRDLFWQFDNARQNSGIGELISRCVRWKARIVEEDEFENGPRKLLNLGHTPAHAIEKCSDYTVSHGHAVAAGMAIMARASEKLGFCRKPVAEEVEKILVSNGLPTGTEFSASELAAAALADKKRSGSEITVVIPVEIGKCELKKIPVTGLEELFRAGLEG
ncbi:MAG: 3-dehydroquinate synthase [Clostridiales bacterium]|nr:3-dehydroquinate synthase [Clostridiales bacterium]